MENLCAETILSLIQVVIEKWHRENESRSIDADIVTDEIRRIRTFGKHRDNILSVVEELTVTNTEMWHEEDKIRSMNNEVVLRAIRNVNPLNQHRNDLVEEIDEIFMDKFKKGGE